jgi:ABC-type antimicrobial peptide transport system permease subunit
MAGDRTSSPRRARPRLSARALIDEAAAGVASRPGRAALTSLGTVLGVASLVATVGLASTAGAQILTRFDQLAATDVVVQARTGVASVIPWSAEADIRRLNGVSEVGTITPVLDSDGHGPTVDVFGAGGNTAGAATVPVSLVSPGAFGAVKASLTTGRRLSAADERLHLPVAVLGPAAARRLSITSVASRPTVFVGGHPFTVVGIVDDVRRRPELLGAVMLPTSAGQDWFGVPAPALVQIETVLGANEIIRKQAPLALAPNDPDRLTSSSPPMPKEVRANVASDVRALMLLLGAVSMVVGALGIANVTLVSVLERTGEIGIRRAMGALRRHVAAQFLLESTFLGLIGGVIGTSTGLLIVVGVSAAKDWSPVISPLVAAGAPFLGALVGFIAGVYPAHRASAIEPSEALRGAL